VTPRRLISAPCPQGGAAPGSLGSGGTTPGTTFELIFLLWGGHFLAVNPFRLLGKSAPAGRHVFECPLHGCVFCLRRVLFGLGRFLSVSVRTQRHVRRPTCERRPIATRYIGSPHFGPNQNPASIGLGNRGGGRRLGDPCSHAGDLLSARLSTLEPHENARALASAARARRSSVWTIHPVSLQTNARVIS
jgi:hypothetical protein